MANEKRLIDANKLITRIQGTESEVARNAPYDAEWFTRMADRQFEILEMIDDAPTVDAVEVVRCKDCIHFDERRRTVGNVTGKVYCFGYCYHWDYEQGMSPNQVLGDDFCSYGERRTDD